jgi:hypothetical protein
MSRQITLPVGPIGAGVECPLGNTEWVTVNYLRCRIDTTATVGNRQFLFIFLDGSGDLMYTAVAPLVGPSIQSVHSMGGGVGVVAGVAWFTFSLPTSLLMPPNSNIFIRDGNAVDAADNIVKAVVVIS